jgi:hypothetical protein
LETATFDSREEVSRGVFLCQRLFDEPYGPFSGEVSPNTSKEVEMRLVTGILAALLLVSFSSVAMAAEKPKPFRYPEVGTRQLLDCTNAIPINCGDIVTGDNTGMPNNVDYYSCTGWTESGGEVVYELVLDDCYIVTVGISGMSADLDVFFLGSCDEADCITYGDTGFTTDCMLPGTYYVVVDGYYGAASPYTLTLDCTICDCPQPPCCPTPFVCLSYDFNESACGWFPMPCLSGAPVWQWGADNTCIPGVACDDVPVTTVLGTVLNGSYVNSAGEIAVIGPIFLDDCCWCMELCHYYDIEDYFDGGNVKVSTDGGVTWT